MKVLPAAFSLGAFEAAVRARIDRLEIDRFPTRLWSRDATLWGGGDAHEEVARRRLGWLESPMQLRPRATDLESFAREVHGEGFTHAVLLGMGGSSLAPEVLHRTFGTARGGLALTVLDTTSPTAIRAATTAHDPATTLFVVASKSGGTIEVASLERHFWTWAEASLGTRAGRSFAAITDPGTALEQLAAERGYRRTFLNAPDIGGRYSALSYFGMVPAALIGADLVALLERALEEVAGSRAAANGGEVPTGFVLGAALGELARQGRDKLTLVLGREMESFGTWVEQLVAESTGKSGRGIVPVVEEHLGLPETYGPDRVFVAFSADAFGEDVLGGLDALARAGHPVLRWRNPDRSSIGAEFLRWEIATVTASAILEVDPFDEPNVTEAKQATQAVLARDAARPPHVVDARAVEIEVPEMLARDLRSLVPRAGDPAAWAAALLAQARPGDYFALLAYLPPTAEIHERLQRIRHAARGAARIATTLGYGPRFLHSTGQLHKGGPGTGLYLQLTADDGEDVAIPGMPYGFRSLIRAQAAGDYEVLERRGRRVIHVHLGDRPLEGMDLIAETLAAARV